MNRVICEMVMVKMVISVIYKFCMFFGQTSAKLQRGQTVNTGGSAMLQLCERRVQAVLLSFRVGER